MKRSILLLARELHLGGSERQLAEIAMGLDRSRFEPHVGTFRPQGLRGDDLRAAGIPIAHFPVYSFRSRAALAGVWGLARYIHRNHICLVHAFDAPLSVYSVLVARFFTSAVVVSSQRGHRSLTPEYRKLLRLTDRLVDGIVVNCDYLKRHLIEEEHARGPLIHVCYNGIDLESFRRLPGPRPPELPADAVVIGVVCALRPEKGLPLLKWNQKPSKKGIGFEQPPQPHQHWHIDVSYLNIAGTFYHLCSVLDGFSRLIVHWELREFMKEADIEITLQAAN